MKNASFRAHLFLAVNSIFLYVLCIRNGVVNAAYTVPHAHYKRNKLTLCKKCIYPIRVGADIIRPLIYTLFFGQIISAPTMSPIIYI